MLNTTQFTTLALIAMGMVTFTAVGLFFWAYSKKAWHMTLALLGVLLSIVIAIEILVKLDKDATTLLADPWAFIFIALFIGSVLLGITTPRSQWPPLKFK